MQNTVPARPQELERPPIQENSAIADRETDRSRTALFWLRRFGLVGLLFFFVKGLLWLVVSILIARAAMES